MAISHINGIDLATISHINGIDISTLSHYHGQELPGGGGPSVDLLSNLVSYWEMEETKPAATPTDTIDAHGSNDLTDVGSMDGTHTGVVGDCRQLNGTGHYFSHATNSDLETGDIDFTFAAWCRAPTLQAFAGIVLKNDNGVNQEYGQYLDSSVMKWYVCSGASASGVDEVAASTFGALSTDTWYFIVCGHDATANEIFISINAGAQNTTAHSGGVYVGAADFTIGGTSGSADWVGYVDQVGFWKRRLSTDDITWLYNAGAGRSYASLI
jgi:hypothetical protein